MKVYSFRKDFKVKRRGSDKERKTKHKKKILDYSFCQICVYNYSFETVMLLYNVFITFQASFASLNLPFLQNVVVSEASGQFSRRASTLEACRHPFDPRLISKMYRNSTSRLPGLALGGAILAASLVPSCRWSPSASGGRN